MATRANYARILCSCYSVICEHLLYLGHDILLTQFTVHLAARLLGGNLNDEIRSGPQVRRSHG